MIEVGTLLGLITCIALPAIFGWLIVGAFRTGRVRTLIGDYTRTNNPYAFPMVMFILATVAVLLAYRGVTIAATGWHMLN